MVPTLQTERLILRPLELTDVEQVQQLFPHWEVVKHLNSIVPWPYPPNGSLTHIRDVTLPAIQRGDEWGWSIRLKSQPEQLIGRISLYKGDNNNRGFWLGIPWHGKGYMTEACDAATDFWFETLGFEVLRVPKAIDNAASRKISLHQGMRVIRQEMRDYVSGKLPSEVWELTREEWRRKKAENRKAQQI